jgi:hypothetical protein
MLHKTHTHCSPNLIFADVLNDSYMHTIFFSQNKNTAFWEIQVKSQDLENVTAEYIGIIGPLKMWQSLNIWKKH